MKILGMEIFVVGSILAVSFCCFAFLATAQITDPSEVAALLAIKSSLIDPMKHLKNWDKGDPCILNWTGVYCFNASGTDGYAHVREIHLLNMNLSGSLAPELGKLSHVEVLDFMWNDITGSLPKEIGNIASLKLLLLNGNKLSGSLPDEIGYLANLNRLQVDENNISGPIPKSFASLSQIRHLHLNNNSISGQIPRELSNVSSLIHLLLDNNNVSGYLPPELSDLPDLRILQLDNNHFVEIPASYANFPKLVKLSLRNCSLQGPVPDLSRIPKLSYLDLSRNQLVGSIPSNKLSDHVTTINLSDNKLNGSIPGNFSNLPNLQKLDLQNNSFSNILGVLNPPANVTVRLQGNPICNSADIENIDQFCGSGARGDETHGSSTNSTIICPIQACPVDNFFEYVPASPVPCFCALPLIIGYRLKSPSFSYFAPYKDEFKMYLTSSLNLDLYQLYIDPYIWEKGPRLRMAFKLFPKFDNKSSMFNMSEIQRIGNIFTTWAFPPNDFFGPYELLSFTLTGPYLNVLVSNGRRGGISKGILAAIVLVAGSCTITISGIFVVLMIRRKSRRFRKMSAKHPSSKISLKIDEVKCFTLKEMQLATENFNNLTLVGQGGYGNVYKGILADRTIVAIKRAQQGSLQGEKEFLTEIELLSRLHHRNLVSLVGYCDEEGEQMLIYEFMPNGTLRDWLSGKLKGNLSFSTRLHIALDSAKGILYLHTEANPPIFHRDIKASNILLDSNLTAKVADFGLSRLAPVPDDEGTLPGHVSTIVKGTPVRPVLLKLNH